MGSCCLMHACSTTSGAESVSISYRFRNEVQASRQARSNNNRDQTAYNLHSNSKDPPNRHRYPVERRTSIIKHACIQNSEKPLIRQSVQNNLPKTRCAMLGQTTTLHIIVVKRRQSRSERCETCLCSPFWFNIFGSRMTRCLGGVGSLLGECVWTLGWNHGLVLCTPWLAMDFGACDYRVMLDRMVGRRRSW
jgi:hypothetical protein